MDVKTQAGDVFVLGSERILVYGIQGIVLKLGQRNLRNLREVSKAPQALKDTDMSGRRFIIDFNEEAKAFRLEIKGGETVNVEAWQIVPEVLMRAA